jgi:hypothetical protein
MAFVRTLVLVASAQSRFRLTAVERGLPAPIGAAGRKLVSAPAAVSMCPLYLKFVTASR